MAALLVAVVILIALVSPPEAKAEGNSRVIVLDPGHSWTSITTIDPATNIRDEEYPNHPEIENSFDVAQRLKTMLESAGYTVLMTKTNLHDSVTKRQRVDLADNAHAALAVSIHTSGHTFGVDYGQIFVQRTDGYRVSQSGKKVFFALPDVAATSAAYGQIFQTERRKIEGKEVVVKVNSYSGRGLADGNLAIVQLWSTVPWLLCEGGVPKSDLDRELYAESLFNAIVRCVPIDPQPTLFAPLPRLSCDALTTAIWRAGTRYTYTAATVKAASVKFYLDGVLKRTDYVAPFTWSVTPTKRAVRAIKIVATAANGNTTTQLFSVVCQ